MPTGEYLSAEALRRSELTYRTLVESSRDLIWSVDLNGRWSFLNGAARTIYGYDPAEMIGRSFVEFELPEQARIGQEMFERIQSGAVNFVHETFHVRKDGALVPLRFNAVVLRDEQGRIQGATGTAQDITERKETEAALYDRERELRLITNSLPGPVSHLDRNLRYLFVNDQYERVYCKKRSSVIGRTLPEVLGVDFFKNIEPDIRRVLDGGRPIFESQTRTLVGGVAHWLVSLVPDLDTDRAVTGFFVISLEITERKHAEEAVRQLNTDLEKRVKERTLQLARKNKELETFTYAVAHDLKAPLRGMDGYSRLLLEDYADKLDGEGRTFLANIRHSTWQMNQLIDDLLDYSKLERHTIEHIEVSPAQVVGGLISIWANDVDTRGIALQVKVPPEIRVMADAHGLAMALRNLIDNAIKFTRQTPHPLIEIGGRVEGSAIVLWVRDNGPGFDPKFGERIFEIFQRLHRAEEYPGTGVGLAIVRKAMERMGGRTWAESQLGAGATFFLELPIAAGSNPPV